MTKLASEISARLSTTPISSYDSTKWNLGTLIRQYSGVNPEDNYITTQRTVVARPFEEAVALSTMYPYAITISPTIDWIFLVQNLATAVATRAVVLYEYNKTLNTYNWKGFITMTLPTATAHTIRGFRVPRYLHTTGTVGVSGTAVTGTATQFVTERLAVGARIGFGSTDPNDITTWYVISAIGSDTGITLQSSAGTITAGTPYVIEELRPMIETTNATLVNGGLFIAKGINYSDFAPAGTKITASTSNVDNLKLVYKISDAASTTIRVGGGVMTDDEISKTEHYAYIINGTTSLVCYKINLRAADAITNGQMVLTGSNIVITGAQAVTGTCSQTNNGRYGVINHGPAPGVESLYFVTTTRIYRASVADITAGNTNWITDARVEVPPGGASTFPLLSTMNSIEYVATADVFLITTTTGRLYITKFPAISGDRFDYVMGINMYLNDSSLSDSDAPRDVGNFLATAFSVWSENGVCHIARQGTTALLIRLTNIPFAAHSEYAATTNQRLISPEIFTPNNYRFSQAIVNEVKTVGVGSLKLPLESYKLYYRISGISDNSGSWIAVGSTGDISAITVSNSIQFMFEFDVISIGAAIPARILGITVTYDDLTTDFHYLPSADLSNKTTKTFAWKHSVAFGGVVPTLRIRLFNAVTDFLLDDDDSVTQSGTWEKSTDGTTWSAFDTVDKANETTFVRFTPASIPDNLQVKAVLMLN
jgi:hypothetical protein